MWKIPPCVSNWKNAKGYVIPLDKRIAADGRGLQDVTVSERHAQFAEDLYIAETKARQEIRIRNELAKQKATREQESEEQKLRDLAAKARRSRTNAFAGGRSGREEVEDYRKQDEARAEVMRETLREHRMEKAGRNKQGRDRDEERDISELIALGKQAMLLVIADRSSANKIYQYDAKRLEQAREEYDRAEEKAGGSSNSAAAVYQRQAPVQFEAAGVQDQFGLSGLLDDDDEPQQQQKSQSSKRSRGELVPAMSMQAGISSLIMVTATAAAALFSPVHADSTRQMFLDAYPGVRDTVLRGIGSYLTEGGLGADDDVHVGVCNYFEKCINYNCLGGKMTRGMTVVATYVALCGEFCDHVKDAITIGWGVEFLQASFLMFDDVMDQSETRRGSTCWYKLPEVSMPNSLNDVVFIENAVYTLLIEATTFDPEIKLSVMRLCHDITLRTIVGQHLDLNSVRPEDVTVDLSRYTMERYWAITAYKTAYYSFWLPVALGMAMARFPKDDPDYQRTKEACITLGNYFQAQDDILDVFADPKVIGKVGTDISESKCSYVFLKARELLETEGSCQSKALLSRLNELYQKRSKTEEEVAEVKSIFTKSGVKQAFERFEEEEKAKIDRLSQGISNPGLRRIIEGLTSKIYHRGK
ncbi:hypothetical protein FOL46_000830 [Perkinsus olseni]|uniref:SKI-interacting protein SKIP SNW domain-containing protein n=1 Tax=Perkinsus olseni TaxID=32597 RepID=A0A7J6MVK4_PEROL|nr:hypothetical protein FOL46_000830 [Perkinsus olseni]